MIVIGIDPGTHTGLATVESNFDGTKKLLWCASMKIHDALTHVEHWRAQGILLGLVFEDARLQGGGGGWKGDQSARSQGAGSVKRDSAIWDDFLRDRGIVRLPVSATKKGAKWSQAELKAATGWAKSSNEHGRDAAKLAWVFGPQVIALARDRRP